MGCNFQPLLDVLLFGHVMPLCNANAGSENLFNEGIADIEIFRTEGMRFNIAIGSDNIRAEFATIIEKISFKLI